MKHAWYFSLRDKMDKAEQVFFHICIYMHEYFILTDAADGSSSSLSDYSIQCPIFAFVLTLLGLKEYECTHSELGF